MVEPSMFVAVRGATASPRDLHADGNTQPWIEARGGSETGKQSVIATARMRIEGFAAHNRA
jgi:hypothetical protein